MLQINKIHNMNALKGLKQLPDGLIDCIMTSPPYWALRDYSTEGQLGLEPTFDEYIVKLCDIFDEVKRVLKPSGTCWVNLGDTYGGLKGGGPDSIEREKNNITWKDKSEKFVTRPPKADVPDKSLTLVPFRFAIEMINRGWILRNVIIWHKPNCMPSSAKDRFTVDFEYVFFFSKQKKYFFEAQYEGYTQGTIDRVTSSPNTGSGMSFGTNNERYARLNKIELTGLGRNKRTVWSICPQPFPECHFAVYPEALCETPLKSGCPEFVCKKCGKAREKVLEPSPQYKILLEKTGGWQDKNMQDGMKYGHRKKTEVSTVSDYRHYGKWNECSCNVGFEGGIVLDPFIGAGTTALVALKQNKRFIGFEINQNYIDIANKRIKPFLEQTKLTEVFKNEI